MVSLNSKMLEGILKFCITITLLIWLNMVASHFFFRVDLTEEKRYSIKDPTKTMLSDLNEVVYVEVFLDGNLNPSFKRLQKGIREILDEFAIYSDNKVQYVFTDPTQAKSNKGRNEYYNSLASKGLVPTTVFENVDGSKQQKLIFPGALIRYQGKELSVMLLKGNSQGSPEQKINQSIELLEFEFANKINLLLNKEKKKIGYVVGHQELDSLEGASFINAMQSRYDVSKLKIGNISEIEGYDALVIAKPKSKFSEQDKYKLDQYILRGGRVAFFVDALEVNMDSIGSADNLALPYELNLDDLFFKYGVRIEKGLVQDQNAAGHPVVTGFMGDQPQVNLLPWPYFPVVNNFGTHPAVKSMDAVVMRFANVIDTIAVSGVKKEVVLMSSPYSRFVPSPANVTLNMLKKSLKTEQFSASNLPMGYMLEGKFTSLYKNRFLPEGIREGERLEVGENSKVLIIADGDIVKNAINPKTNQPYSLGYDPYAKVAYANENLVMNLLSSMLDEHGLIVARAKELKIRPLDKLKIEEERGFWQFLNLIVPLVVLVLFGLLKYKLRQIKYTKN